VLRFVVSEALRDLRRAGRVAVAAVVLTALALGAAGAFWLLSSNLGRAVADWRERVRIIAYLEREPPPAEVGPLIERVRALPHVAGARYVSKGEALATLKRVLGKDAAVAESLPSNPLPASIQVTPTARGATPEGALALIMRLEALPEVEEVAGGVEWVERLSHWRQLLASVGVGVGAMLVLAAVLTVTTATTLVLHARRREMEILRLVGAPEAVIRLPLLLQGMFQGLLGAALALVALWVGHRVLAPWLGPLMALTIGLPQVEFFSESGMLTLVAAGVGLGGLGGALAKGRGGAM
jgi:cell division transport system permease protein